LYILTKKTQDYKYYSKNVWVLLDANGNTVSITDTMPASSKDAEVANVEK
jgi:glycine cleavage system H lipoate-binding protein